MQWTLRQSLTKTSSHHPARWPNQTPLQAVWTHQGELGPKAIAFPSVLLANVRSQENKMDEIRFRLTQQRGIRDCCAHIFTETSLCQNILKQAISLDGQTIFRTDRTQNSDKTRRGRLCVYINSAWCSNVIKVDGQCFPDVEMLTILSVQWIHQCFCHNCLHSTRCKFKKCTTRTVWGHQQ